MSETQTKSFLNALNLVNQKNFEGKNESFILHDWDFLDFTHGTLFRQISKCHKRSQKQHRIIKAWNNPYFVDNYIDDKDEVNDIKYLVLLHLIGIHKLIYNSKKHCYTACELQLSSFGKDFYHDIRNKIKFFSVDAHNITKIYLNLCHKNLSKNAINIIRKTLCKEYINTTCSCHDYYPLIRHVFNQL